LNCRRACRTALNVGGFLPIGLHSSERHLVFRTVLAYVDPGVGATILQLALAGTVGVGALVKLRWRSIKKALGREEDVSTATPEEATESPQ
jgi:hypothetical protein